MRIIAGANRGRRLASVGKGDAAAALRPTGDRVRESLFNVLRSHDLPSNETRVLDLFAGTGALGLEALSRGAAGAVFVENGRKALALLGQNIALCRAEGVARVLRRDARRIGRVEGAPCGLVFLDPPYGRDLGEAALAAAMAGGWIAPGALIAWEEGAEITPPMGCEMLDERRYGETRITLLRAPG
ncbi:16S rRNA (guanine(966)-N(2))-methyltransferase RsmD [Roseovarius spongiae]|uniref:16S rRNA (Guanine(966)-N(2))-methyltransferase RsmD n=1 Tax=Roseovarius spongiae TaxID=2320272 RepID=A0A3A8AQN1_9RHOB|nr:16S rRNA (guanine(966)-N(2))-methyltransferase RsmD [Roseovarius spongiae]RKF12873.1 16S rRNA (guanine(966)-N(2))-methyltransferase RsmD [Roseovarius spongiae]